MDSILELQKLRFGIIKCETWFKVLFKGHHAVVPKIIEPLCCKRADSRFSGKPEDMNPNPLSEMNNE